VQILSKGDYWNALRGFADYVVVDAPSLERSRAALAVARHMDASVLVVAAGSADRTAPARAREAIEEAGGRCAGVVFNKAPEEPPAFVRRLVP
jgi:Mrp family chromosome partitioning ATPase